MGAGLPTGIARALAVDPVNPTVLYAAMTVGFGTDGGLFVSVDSGATFSATGCTGIAAAAVTVRPNGDVLIAAEDNIAYPRRGGVYRSTDGAASCPLASHGISAFQVVALAAAGTLYMGADSTGAYRSTDGGASWSDIHQGLDGIDKIVHALAVDPNAPSTVYQTSGNTLNDRLWKSLDGGDSWTTVRGPFPLYESLAIDPVDPDNVFLGLGEIDIPPIFIPASVERTADGGATWATTSLSVEHVYVLAVDPTNHLTVYAGTDAGVLRSVDGGATFSPLGIGIPADQPVIGLAIDSANPSVLYALAVDLHSGTPGGVFKSVDAGATFVPQNSGLPSLYLRAIAFDPTPPSAVYVGADSGGIFRSVDGAATWSAVNEGLFDPHIRSLAVDPTVPGRIYAGTIGSSVFVRDFPPPCGDGVAAGCEQCDDGAANGTPASCCTAACGFRSAGAACGDDGDLCSNDQCDAAGLCTHVFAPDPLCAIPTTRGGALKIVNRPATSIDQVKFKFAKGPAIGLPDFGAPNGATTYALCVYDETSSGPTLAYRGRPLPPCNTSPCWTARPNGWTLRSAGGPDGVTTVILKSGVAGKTNVDVRAKRAALVLPPLPVAKAPSVVAEVRTSDGACWGATFSSPTKNDSVQFNARSD